MTPAEQKCADDRMRAEIAKLFLETGRGKIRMLLLPALSAAALMGITAVAVILVS